MTHICPQAFIDPINRQLISKITNLWHGSIATILIQSPDVTNWQRGKQGKLCRHYTGIDTVQWVIVYPLYMDPNHHCTAWFLYCLCLELTVAVAIILRLGLPQFYCYCGALSLSTSSVPSLCNCSVAIYGTMKHLCQFKHITPINSTSAPQVEDECNYPWKSSFV